MQDWLSKIRSTRNHVELLAVTREYLANWYHGDLAEIAEEFRPARIRDVSDIHYWSERLAEGYHEAVHGRNHHFHREMHDFFLEASRHAEDLPRRGRGSGGSRSSPADAGAS